MTDSFIFNLQNALNLGYHCLITSDEIIQCVRCNAECLSATIETYPVICHFTKEIICFDCFSNLISPLASLL